MRQASVVLLVFVVSVSSTLGFAQLTPESIEQRMVKEVTATLNHQPAPLLAKHYSLTIAQAYRVQTRSIKEYLAGDEPQGFKAGLTSQAGQQKFAVNHPVAGVLLAVDKLSSATQPMAVSKTNFHRLMMEAELGFRLNQRVTQPVTDVKQVQALVGEILPVVELPDLSFDQLQAVTGLDIIANNVLAKQAIAGVPVSIEGLNINALTVTVRLQDELILTGKGSDAMGDQWLALQWLINQTVASGWEIQPGQLLITGALGKMIPAQEGLYQVDYGPLGKIDFLVK